MQLLAPSTGWALGNGRLFWTADNGEHWTDITPDRHGAPDTIEDVFFRDEINGWVLLKSRVGDDMMQVALATTTDGGHTWFFADVPIPNQFPDELSGAAWVDFVDAAHGWVVLKKHTSSAFSTARLFQTQDGGATWRELPQTPLGVRPVFVSPADGFLVGGNFGSMYRSHDGGRTWEGVDLEEPSAPSGIIDAAFGRLAFTDAKHGSVPVTFSPMDGPSMLVLFTTSDGGSTWKAKQVLRLPNRYNEDPPPSAVVDSTLLFIRDTHVTAVGSDNTANTAGVGSVSQDTWFNEISFTSSTDGWLRESDGTLLSTADGGRTLIWLVPGSAPRPLPQPRKITGHVRARALGPQREKTYNPDRITATDRILR